MEMQADARLAAQLAETFSDRRFLRKLGLPREQAAALFGRAPWAVLTAPLVPVRTRLRCADALAAFRPLLEQLAPEPAEGWLRYAYQVAVSLLYPAADRTHTSAQWDGALCFLQFLQVLLGHERQQLPFDPWLDFAFCTEKELTGSGVAGEYRQFLQRFREEYIYELLRLGREVTPFHTLEHIAGVHHVALTCARRFRENGGLIDLGLLSGAAAGHDLGKFGCRPGERVPYLHYYYTDQWFLQRGLTALGHIAANHSVWDLELEDLSSESLALVYADFRVKQIRDGEGREQARLFTLADAFDVILSKLDRVDSAKHRRYRYVYEKLRDFEKYLISFGVDTDLGPGGPPLPQPDAALLSGDEVVETLCRMAVDHNIRLMHQLSREHLFAAVLEAARGEKSPARQRAYVSIFEEYFTYWNAGQKEQALQYLYELLLSPDGNIRRQAAILMGRILAEFRTVYKKELPAGAPPDPQEDRPFQLWAEYLGRLIHPDRRLTPRQASLIRYQAKTVADAVLGGCSDEDAPRFAGLLFRHYQLPRAVDPDTAFALLDTVVNVPLDRVDEAAFRLLIDFAAWWLAQGEAPQKAAALRLFRRLLPALPADSAERRAIAAAVASADCGGSTPLIFLRLQLGRALDLPGIPHPDERVLSGVLLGPPDGRRCPAGDGPCPDAGTPQ